jgi:hypothetical protein
MVKSHKDGPSATRPHPPRPPWPPWPPVSSTSAFALPGQLDPVAIESPAIEKRKRGRPKGSSYHSGYDKPDREFLKPWADTIAAAERDDPNRGAARVIRLTMHGGWAPVRVAQGVVGREKGDTGIQRLGRQAIEKRLIARWKREGASILAEYHEEERRALAEKIRRACRRHRFIEEYGEEKGAELFAWEEALDEWQQVSKHV